MNNNLDVNKIKRINKESGNEKRISRKSIELIQEELSEYTNKVLDLAATYADHAGRNTILIEDVKLVLKELR